MPRRYTMPDLVQRCQQRVDMENDALIASDEWCRLISEAYGELYTIVFEAGLEYFEYVNQQTTDGTNVLTEIPDHLGTMVFSYLYQASPAQYRDLRPLQAQERSRMSGINAGSWATHYALVDDRIYLYPTPPAGQVYEMRYCPQPPELPLFTGDNPTLVDVVTPDGLAFLIWNVAVMAQAKSSTDPGLAMKRLEEARGRFQTSVRMRMLDSLHQIVDTDNGGGSLW